MRFYVGVVASSRQRWAACRLFTASIVWQQACEKRIQVLLLVRQVLVDS